MKLQEIFDQLGTAEFAQISIGKQPAGIVNDENQKLVVNHLNLGLTALYTRFNLKMGEVRIKLLPNVYLYQLHSRHSLLASGPQGTLKYLDDSSVARFKDDVLKVEQCTLDDGSELDLNNLDNPWSLHTPSATWLQVPADVVDQKNHAPKTANLKLRYRADAPKLVLPAGGDVFDASRVEVELPNAYLVALLWFIASRAHNPVGMGQEFNSGNTYYAKFEAECKRLEEEGLQVDTTSQPDRLHRNGWV